MIGADLMKYNLQKYKFLVLDFETSCLQLGLQYNRVWQASWLLTKGDKITKSFDYYVNWPELYVSPGAQAATGFNKELVEKEGKDPLTVLQEFNQYFYDTSYTIIGFNVLNFDFYLHSLWMKSFHLPVNYDYIPRVIDVRALFLCYKLGMKFDPNINFVAQQYRFLTYRKKGLKNNLRQVCLELNIPFDEKMAHNANYDIARTLDAGIALIKLLEI